MTQLIPEPFNFSQVKKSFNMLSIIIGKNSMGKSFLLKRLNEMIFNPKYLISEFPSKSTSSLGDFQNVEGKSFGLDSETFQRKKVYLDLFLRDNNIERYKNSINNFISSEKVDYEQECLKIDSSGIKKGFTYDLNLNDYNQARNKLLRNTFVENNIESLLKTNLDKKELEAFLEKYKRILKDGFPPNESMELFIQRQILKKILFTNLFLFLKQDCFYKCEINSINELLGQKNFPYSIHLGSNEINEEKDIILMHRKKNFKRSLTTLSLNERLILHICLIIRDRDVIKIHEPVNFNQILLFDEIDNNLDLKHSEELLKFIQFYFVQNMNIQCIFTTNNQLTIAKCNNDCLFQMNYRDEKFVLDKLSSLDEEKFKSKELIAINKAKMKFVVMNKALEFQSDKKTRAEMSLFLNDLTLENQSLKEELENQKVQSNRLIQELKEKINKLNKETARLHDEIEGYQQKAESLNKHDRITFKTSSEETNKSNIEKSIVDFDSKYKDILGKNLNEINDKDAKEFIEFLSLEADGFQGRSRDIIAKSIELLGPNLYTSQFNFLNELVQNFDDTRYLSEDDCCLKVVLSKKFILFSSNQLALRPKEVRSICSIGESTKTKGEFTLIP